MALYKYQATTRQGSIITGELKAKNEEDLHELLLSEGLTLTNARIIQRKFLDFSPNITSRELINLCMQLQQMQRAKIPITETILDISNNAPNKTMQNLMLNIHEAMVKDGKMLSEALAVNSKYFDSLFVNLVRIGEETNSLELIFKDLGDHLSWQDTIIKKIKKAMYYPIFLFIMMIFVVVMLLITVVPKLYDFMNAQGFEIPVYTRALIATAEIFEKYYIQIFIIATFLIFGVIFCIKLIPKFKYYYGIFILKIPIIGSTILKIEIARFCRFFGICYKSNMPILEALNIAKDIVNNLKIKNGISNAMQAISDGGGIASAFTKAGIFPSSVTRMLSLGETSGKLTSMLDYINQYYDEEVNDTIEKLIAMIKPTMMLILGGMMGWVATSMLGPLYSSIAKINL